MRKSYDAQAVVIQEDDVIVPPISEVRLADQSLAHDRNDSSEFRCEEFTVSEQFCSMGALEKPRVEPAHIDKMENGCMIELTMV